MVLKRGESIRGPAHRGKCKAPGAAPRFLIWNGEITAIGMKVAMFGPFTEVPAAGGVEQHVHHLADSLEKIGVEVERWSWKAGMDGGKIKKCSLFGLKSAFDKTGADIIHLHSSAIAFSAISGLGRFEGKAAATIHAFHNPAMESSLRYMIMGIALGPLYKSALRNTRNIAVSEYTRKEAASYGIKTGEVIGSGVDLKEIEDTRPSEEESDAIIVARFNRQKGVMDFIEAFSGIAYNARIVGYGERSEEEKIAGIAAERAIKCTVRASRQEMLGAIKSSKLLAMPSKGETFGIVGLEAMAMAKPVIVYREAGGPLDYVKDGYNGMVISSSPRALRIAANRLLEDEEMYGKLSANALRSAKEHGWGKVARKVKEFYESLLREESGPSLYYRKR